MIPPLTALLNRLLNEVHGENLGRGQCCDVGSRYVFYITVQLALWLIDACLTISPNHVRELGSET